MFVGATLEAFIVQMQLGCSHGVDYIQVGHAAATLVKHPASFDRGMSLSVTRSIRFLGGSGLLGSSSVRLRHTCIKLCCPSLR